MTKNFFILTSNSLSFASWCTIAFIIFYTESFDYLTPNAIFYSLLFITRSICFIWCSIAGSFANLLMHQVMRITISSIVISPIGLSYKQSISCLSYVSIINYFNLSIMISLSASTWYLSEFSDANFSDFLIA